MGYPIFLQKHLGRILLACLAYSCIAQPTYGAEQTPLLQHANSNRTVSAALFTELEELARIVDISYCVGLTSLGINKPFQCLSRCSEFPDFELIKPWNTGVMLSDSCGYLALDHGKKRIIVAFRGTYSISNTIADLSTVPQKYEPYPGSGPDDTSIGKNVDAGESNKPKCLNCTVHSGFHTSWMNTRDVILTDLEQQILLHQDYQLTLVGHSLGGAVAALAGLEMESRSWDPVITTFGEPRVGNAGFVKYLDDRFNLRASVDGKEGGADADTKIKYRRVTHIDDPVPLLPLSEWGYAMHAGEIFISKSALSPDVTDMQHCEADNDHDCIAGQDETVITEGGNLKKRSLITDVQDEVADVMNEPWGIPSRYKLWQLFFAHRDYFWRIGLCVPGGDPMGGGSKYEPSEKKL